MTGQQRLYTSPTYQDMTESVPNPLHSAAVQNILQKGYLPRIVTEAMKRLDADEKESTSASIVDEIEKIKNEKNLREELLKTPNKDMRNIPIPEDDSELRDKISHMRSLLFCRNCTNQKPIYVIKACGHRMCYSCIESLKSCVLCHSEIRGNEDTMLVKYGNAAMKEIA